MAIDKVADVLLWNHTYQLQNVTNSPGRQLAFHARQVEIFLGVGYALGFVFAVWALWIHARSLHKEVATIWFYLLIATASLSRCVWFASPQGLQSLLHEPLRVKCGEPGWTEFLVQELMEMVGEVLLYALFVLIVVFWSDMLRRLFTHEHVRSHPLRVFLMLLWIVVCVLAMGFVLFLCKQTDSFWLVLYDDIVLTILSLLCFTSILIYSYRMKTVLRAFLEVSQIDTTERLRAVQSATLICLCFLLANGFFLGFSIVSVMQFHEIAVLIPRKAWWLVVAAKHAVEIVVIAMLLFFLWGKEQQQSSHKHGYEPIRDVLSDEETGEPTLLHPLKG